MAGPPQSDNLLEAALALAKAHDLDDVLGRIVEAACSVLGARYGALGIYEEGGTIQRFVHRGVDASTVAAIGHLPLGRGLLGQLVVGEGPLRVARIERDPRSCGFPPHHPPMRGFLGAPIVVAGRRFGNLYVAEKTAGDEFDAADEAVVSALATFAACAIENALLIEAERERAITLGELAAARERERAQQELLARTIATQEFERSRVARDLHDQVGQELTSVLLGLRMLESAENQDERDEAIGDVRGLVTESLRTVRDIAFALRPTVLDDLGLVHALRRLADDTARRAGIDVEFDTAGFDSDWSLGGDVEIGIYRIAQEALTNVIRHASARRVQLVLEVDDGSIRAIVNDDGAGFDVAEQDGSFGLRSMRERARLIGGRVVIESDRSGTTVLAEVPLAAAP